MFNLSNGGLSGKYAKELSSVEKMREDKDRAKSALTSNVGPKFNNKRETNQPAISKENKDIKDKYSAPEKRVFFMGQGNQAEAEITEDDFKTFINKGTVSEEMLQFVADKIITGKQMSPEEIAVYTEHSNVIEKILQNKQVKK